MCSKFQFNKAYFFTFCMLIMLITVLTGCGKDTKIVLTTGFDDNEIFRIDAEKCGSQEALVYIANIKNQYSSVFGSEIWSIDQGGVSLEDNVKSTVLARLAKIKMMKLLAANYNIELTDQEKTTSQTAAREYYDSLTEEEKSYMGNVTENIIEGMYQDYALADKVYQYLTNDVNVEISDDEARTVLVKQIAILFGNKDGEQIEAAQKQLLQNQAEQARAAISQGKDFEEVLMEYSNTENEILYYRKGELEQNLEDAVFLLGQDEISQVVEGNEGYYIYLCVNPNDTSRTEDSKSQIIADRKKKVFDDIYDMFTVDKKCYLNEELWNTVSYGNTTVDGTSNFFDVYTKYFEAN